MKLHILSDIHNEFSILPHPETEADIIVLAGDIDIRDRAIAWAKNFDKPVLYVLGNHEFYGQDLQEVRQLVREQVQGTNITLLDNDEVIIDDVRFIGGTLWTDFKLYGALSEPISILEAKLKMNDFRHIRYAEKRFMPEDSIQLHQETLGYIKQQLKQSFPGKTVIITHHAPSPQSIAAHYKNDKLSAAFASDLEYLMTPDIQLWIHGHVHNSNDYVVNGTRIISNPRGYQLKDDFRSENHNFDSQLVIEL